MSGVIDDADELFPPIGDSEGEGLKDLLLDSSEEFPLPSVDDFDLSSEKTIAARATATDDLSLPSIDDLMSSLPETPIPDSVREVETQSKPSVSEEQSEVTQEELSTVVKADGEPDLPAETESSPLDLINSAHDMFDDMIKSGPVVLEEPDSTQSSSEPSAELSLSLPESSLQESLPKLVESESFEAPAVVEPVLPELDIKRTLSDAEYFEGESTAPAFTPPGSPPINFEEGLLAARESSQQASVASNPTQEVSLKQEPPKEASALPEFDSISGGGATVSVDIPEFKPAGQASRIDNFTGQPTDDGFPVARPAMIQVPDDIVAPSAFEFDDLPEPPSAPRKVKLSRKHSGADGRKVRPWVPIAGGVMLVAAWLGAGPILSSLMSGSPEPAVALIVASKPKAELFWGEESLGMTPVAIREGQAAGDLQLRKEGFEPLVVAVGDAKVEKPDAPAPKKSFKLQGLPVAANWVGVPADAKLWWDGKEAQTSSLASVPAGLHTLKIKPTDGPSIQVPIEVPNAAELGSGQSFMVGEKVSALLAKRPMMSLQLKLPSGVDVPSVDLTIKGKADGKPTQQKLTLKKGASQKLAVPAEGEYTVAFSGGSGLAAFSTKVTAKAGSATPTVVAPKKPVVYAAPASRPSYTGSNSAPAYRPPPRYRPAYRPAPRPRYRPSGGGGGRIAPPAF